jgi:branched-chain amino acid transport system ATP-binding protein
MLLELDCVTTGYGKAQVLKDVCLHVHQGEIVALLGANGAGKSTTLRCIAGVIQPWEGSVKFEGVDTRRLPPYILVSKGISYCPEGRDVFANLTVLENLKIGAYLVNDEKQSEARLEWVYDLFPRLKERRKQSAASLSGGEQQMLAIGRSLMANPRLLMLDEPSLGVAPILVEAIYSKIEEINASGTSILLVEQNANLALEVADRAYVLEKGEISLEGTGAELRDNEHVKASYLGIA